MQTTLKAMAWPIIAGLLAGFIIVKGLFSNEQRIPAPIVSLAPAAKIAAPAVVNIYTRKVTPRNPLRDDPFFRLFRQDQKEQVQRSLGSGVIVRNDGYIVTNNHVITGADQIQVLLADGRSGLASLVGADLDTDLAVLKIDLENLPTMPIGNAQNISVGDIVLAIGNPYGFNQTVTQGIISYIGRYGLNLTAFEDFIQTDAAINPGNSGGALVDIKGQLIGINSAIYSQSKSSAGIGLAIPADTVMMVVKHIIKHGQVMRGWLGIVAQQHQSGVIITQVMADSPAQHAGLQAGDILLEINDQAILEARQAMRSLTDITPGSEISITVQRLGVTLNLMAIVGVRS